MSRRMTPMVSATIDTGALNHNLERVRHWAPRSRVMAVIKANAYGHGLVAVAQGARGRGCLRGGASRRRAHACEAQASPSARCCSRACSIATSWTLRRVRAFELVVHTAEQIELLRQAGPGAPFKIWLKLDTGMNRLGFKGAAFEQAPVRA